MAARRIFVGDVQGCRVELERLLEAVNFDRAADDLRPVGDLVNRGPDSLGALRLVHDLDATCVLGNHDLHLLRIASGTRRPSEGDTLDDVLAASDRDELLAWLAAQPFLRIERDVVQVHAGLHPAWRTEADARAALNGVSPFEPAPATDFATRVRHSNEAGEKPRDEDAPPAGFAPWFDLRAGAPLDRGRTLVFGHWAARGLVVRDGLRGLDTGCVWGGRLTAWIAEEDRLVHVDAERTYRNPG